MCFGGPPSRRPSGDVLLILEHLREDADRVLQARPPVPGAARRRQRREHALAGREAGGGVALAGAFVPQVRAKRPEWESIAVAMLLVAFFAAGALWAGSQWPDPLF